MQEREHEAAEEAAPPGPAELLALQRSAGNRAVQRLLAERGALGPAGSPVRRLQRAEHGVLDETEEAEEIDDEAAEYIYDPGRNPHTLGQYIIPAIVRAKAGGEANQQADAKLKEASDARAKQEAEVKVKEAADAKIREAAEAQARLEEQAKLAEEAKAREEAEAKAKQAEELKAKLEAEAQAKAVAEALARAEAEAKAKELALAQAKQAAEAQARLEAEAKLAQEAKAKLEAEAKLAEEAKAKLEAEAKARAEAEALAKQEAAAKAKQDAAAKAKQDAEAKTALQTAAKKTEIRDELKTKVRDIVKGSLLDYWAKLSPVQQEGFVQQVFDQKATPSAYLTAKTAAIEAGKAVVRAEREADLQADKVWLNRAVDAANLSGPITEIFKAAIALHKKSDDSYGLTITTAYPEATIVAACREWGLLANTQVIDPNATTPNTRVRVADKLKVMTNLHSPGWQSNTVEYKSRGKFLERTRNLIAVVDGLKSNVHVHPPGGWQKKA